MRQRNLSSSLTPRQAEVIHLLAQGYRQKEIADELGISDNSVTKRAKAAFKKLGASTPAQAVFNFYVRSARKA